MKVFAILYTPIFLILAIAVTLLSLPLFIPFFLMKAVRLNRAAYVYGKQLGRFIGSLYMLSGLVVFSVKGRKNLPRKARNICVMSNHQSYADIACISIALPFRAGFVAKKVLFKVPLLNIWLRVLNCVGIDRANPRASVAAIMTGVKNIKAGFPMVIFPEATRSCGNGMRRFRTGSFKLAYKSDSLILPVTIDGAYRIIEKHMAVLPFQRVRVTIHPPIDSTQLSHEEKEALPEKLWEQINGSLKIPNSEKMPDRVFK